MNEMIWTMLSDLYASVLLEKCRLPLERDAYLAQAKREYQRILDEAGGIDEGNGLGFFYRWGALNCAFFLAAHGAMTRSHFETLIRAILDDEAILREMTGSTDLFSEQAVAKRRQAALRSQERRYPGDWVFTVAAPSYPDTLAFTYTECCLYKMTHAQRCEELLSVMCSIDYMLFARRGARLTRMHTLSGGSDRCDCLLHKIISSEPV